MKEYSEIEKEMDAEGKNKKADKRALLMSLVAVAALSVAVFVAVGII